MSWWAGLGHRRLAAGLALATGAVWVAGCGGGRVSPAAPASSPYGSAGPTPSVSTSTPRATPTAAPSSAPARPTTAPAPRPTATVLPAYLTGRVFMRIPTTARVVALTFDGGSGTQGVPAVLAALHTARVPATFFLTGRFAQTYPEAARSIAATGVVGNHTMTHPHLPLSPSSAVAAEIVDGERAIDAVVSRTANPWFRFPYGESDARTLAIANGLGYAAVGWTIDTRGWKGRAGAGDVDAIVGRVLAQLQPGAIVLMHLAAAEDGTTLDADSLPKLIAGIRAAGYSFVTVDAIR